MRFEQEFRKAYPETIGEKDREFDLSNYAEWLESLVEDKFKPTNSSNDDIRHNCITCKYNINTCPVRVLKLSSGACSNYDYKYWERGD